MMFDPFNEAKLEELVPAHLRDGLRLYIEQGIQPGHFLTAVLENNLMEAMGRADEISREGLFGICTFLYSYAPGMCLGTPEAVSEWMQAGGMKGLQSGDAA